MAMRRLERRPPGLSMLRAERPVGRRAHRLAVAWPAMLHFLPSVLALSAALVCQGNRAPTAEELNKARPEAVRVLAERILRSRGGDIRLASSELLAAAFDTQDRATRFLLWRQSIDLAVKAGDTWIALQNDRTFATEFGLDPHLTGIELLQRMAAATKDERQIANVSFAAMYAAANHALDEDDTVMLSYFDVAIRAALRSNHAPLYSHVRDYLAGLRAPRAIGKELAESLHNSPWPAAAVASGLLQGETRMLEPFEMRDFKAVFRSYGNVKADRKMNTLTSNEMIELSTQATHPLLETGMLRCAQQTLVRGYVDANKRTRQELCQKIVKLAAQLCTNDGVSRLRFQDRNKHMWTVTSCLAGTVSVYPALGSEIFVREILIDGQPAGLVDTPIGVMM
ncbi:MAG: hypothetical protein ACI85K_001790 [Hyphomicrobiaceae bacterium]|jgi:hypothetical protein